MDDATFIILLIIGTTFAGGIIKGATNLGLNLLAVPALAPFIGVAGAILTIFIAKTVSDVVMLFESRGTDGVRDARRVSGFLVAGFAGVFAGTMLLAYLDRQVLFLILGGFLLIYLLLQARDRPLAIPSGHERVWAPIAGGLSGLCQGLTGAAGPTTAVYMLSLRRTPREFVFLTSVIFLAIDAGQLAGILYMDLYDTTRLYYAAVAFVPVMAGAWIGIRLRNRLSSGGFRKAILTVLFVMGLNLLRMGAGW
jgi:uncharacterized membrane protein YfcA